MSSFVLKCSRYLQCYRELGSTKPRRSLEDAVDYCVDRPILLGQVRSEILELARILETHAPKRSLEIGTNYGGTLFLLCRLSPPDAAIISVDLPHGAFGGGYPLRKVPLFRRFPQGGQRLHLVRADSHSPETKQRIERILDGHPLDYLFIDADHTYRGVESDFRMYSPLLRPGGIVAFHDIVSYAPESACEVPKFWQQIKERYRHLEIVESHNGTPPLAVTGARMETAGIGVLFMA